MKKRPVIIVGAGLAGLSCARRLAREGAPFVLLEASDGVGGRVRTDEVEGFRLDRGFQVLLTAYPECRRQFDYGGLELKTFFPGALVRWNGRFHEVADPWRHPGAGLRGVFNPIGSLMDKIRVGLTRRRALRGPLESLWDRPEASTLEFLRDRHFSPAMVDRFFRPFLGGIFLEKELRTSSRMFEFVFRMMAQGDTAVPARGMEALPRQLAEDLPKSSLHLNTRVVSVEQGKAITSEGRSFEGSSVVLAVDGPAAAALSGTGETVGSRSVYGLYYAAGHVSLNKPVLRLNGEGRGPVNNACVLSAVAPSYAPAGKALISASVLEEDVPSGEDLEAAVRAQLKDWFGAEAGAWRHLRTYHIRHAQPEVGKGIKERLHASRELRPGLFLCGDYTHLVSIQGAMVSGREVAEQVLAF